MPVFPDNVVTASTPDVALLVSVPETVVRAVMLFEPVAPASNDNVLVAEMSAIVANVPEAPIDQS